MIRLDACRARISEKVPELPAARLGNAAQWGVLVQNDRLPTQSPFAYVLPGGLQGGAADAIAGMFRQNFLEVVSVVLLVRVAGDALGDKALQDIDPLLRDVIQAIAGWAPDGAVGVCQLQRAELIGAKDGAVIFQIDFALNDQLRITS